MEQALIRRLRDGTLADYKRLATENGRSLEAELRDVIERNRPKAAKDSARLVALSERLQAATIGGMSSDSAPYIRSLRDTDGARTGDEPVGSDDAGR